jgi:hypothetical protein
MGKEEMRRLEVASELSCSRKHSVVLETSLRSRLTVLQALCCHSLLAPDLRIDQTGLGAYAKREYWWL